MIMAIVLAIIVVASVLFHFVNPWWLTPLASNWKSMDDTLTITLVITGLFFVAINLFVVYTLVRFRHREGMRAAQRARKQVARALADRRHHAWASSRCWRPAWWCMRTTSGRRLTRSRWKCWASNGSGATAFAGADGKLGLTETRFVSATNPFGLDPADPAGQDDMLIAGDEVHLPLGKPVHVLLRSHDVLHDFYVPPFRARMNIVPGQVSTLLVHADRRRAATRRCARSCAASAIPTCAATWWWRMRRASRPGTTRLPTFAAMQANAARRRRRRGARRDPLLEQRPRAGGGQGLRGLPHHRRQPRAWGRHGRACTARPRACATARPRWSTRAYLRELHPRSAGARHQGLRARHAEDRTRATKSWPRWWPTSRPSAARRRRLPAERKAQR